MRPILPGATALVLLLLGSGCTTQLAAGRFLGPQFPDHVARLVDEPAPAADSVAVRVTAGDDEVGHVDTVALRAPLSPGATVRLVEGRVPTGAQAHFVAIVPIEVDGWVLEVWAEGALEVLDLEPLERHSIPPPTAAPDLLDHVLFGALLPVAVVFDGVALPIVLGAVALYELFAG